jgi:hypothetical protein
MSDRKPRTDKTAGYEGIGANRFVNWARLYCRVPELDSHVARQHWIDTLAIKRNVALADVMVDIIRRGRRECPSLDRLCALADRYGKEPLFDGDPAARDRNDSAAKYTDFDRSDDIEGDRLL